MSHRWPPSALVRPGRSWGQEVELSDVAWAGAAGLSYWRPRKRGSGPFSLVPVSPKYSGMRHSPDSHWVSVRAKPPCLIFLHPSPSLHPSLQPSSVQ